MDTDTDFSPISLRCKFCRDVLAVCDSLAPKTQKYLKFETGFDGQLQAYTTEVNTSVEAWYATGSRVLRFVVGVALPAVLVAGALMWALRSEELVFLILICIVCGHALANVLDAWDAKHQTVMARLRELDTKFNKEGRALLYAAITRGRDARVKDAEREYAAGLYSIKAFRAGVEV